MRINKLLPLLFLLVITLTSCGHSYKVEGTTSSSVMDGKLLYLKVLQKDKWVNVDSAEVVHGTFKMKGSIDSVVVASLYMDSESLMPVVLESGTIKIDISDEEMKVSGTPLNDRLYAFIKKKNEMDQKAQDLDSQEAQLVMNGQDENVIRAQMTASADSLMNAENAFVKKFIVDNGNNALGPNVFIMLCSGLPYPVLTPQLEDILKDVPEKFKQNALVSDFIAKAHENAQLMMEQQRMEQSEASRPNKNNGAQTEGEGDGDQNNQNPPVTP